MTHGLIWHVAITCQAMDACKNPPLKELVSCQLAKHGGSEVVHSSQALGKHIKNLPRSGGVLLWILLGSSGVHFCFVPLPCRILLGEVSSVGHFTSRFSSYPPNCPSRPKKPPIQPLPADFPLDIHGH